jgi:hypothetical protein
MSSLEQLLQQKIDELEPYEPIEDSELEELQHTNLNSIEGVSLERWAAISAGAMIGANLDDLLVNAQIDPARWARACEAWNERMARDATLVIASSLGQAIRLMSKRIEERRRDARARRISQNLS